MKDFHATETLIAIGGRGPLLLQCLDGIDDLLQLPHAAVVDAEAMLIQSHRILRFLRHAHWMSLRPLPRVGKRVGDRPIKKIVFSGVHDSSHLFSDRNAEMKPLW
jgi:hypothetical protein